MNTPTEEQVEALLSELAGILMEEQRAMRVQIARDEQAQELDLRERQRV